MSREVEVLREVVVKVTQLLAGKNVKVTQIGTEAKVVTDLRTFQPIRVNIPFIPANATPDYLAAIQGFIDHEIGHVLDTDWEVIARTPLTTSLHGMWNLVEDTFVERKMRERFPGAAFNLEKVGSYFLDKITGPAILAVKGDEVAEFNVMLMPAVRALAGQAVFQAFMDKNGYWDHPLIKAVVDALPESFLTALPKIKSTAEALELSKILHLIIFPPPPPPAPPPPPPPPAPKSKKSPPLPPPPADEDEGEEDESEDDAVGGSAPDTDDSEPADVDDKASEPEPDEEDPEASDDDKASDPEPDEVEIDENEEDEASEPDAASAEPEHENEEDEEGEGEPEHESVGDEAGDGEPEESEAAGSMKPESSPFTKVEVDISKSAMSEALAEHLTELAKEAAGVEEYLPYTRDFDKIEKMVVPATTKSEAVGELDDKTRAMIGPMAKSIERMMAARTQTLRVPGFRSGRLHAGNLHRLNVGDDRVFRRTNEQRSKATAVGLLIDNSGSMREGYGRTSRLQIAQIAAYALSQTLERVGISHEVIGFTTGNIRPIDENALEEETRRIGRGFNRIEPLYMPIFKDFGERMTTEVKRRFAAMTSVATASNIDGESVEIAAKRLMARSEQRKVLIVLSDGEPAGMSSHWKNDRFDEHLASVVKKLPKMGVEVIGIGIESEAVKEFYPRHVVLDSADKLPETVMGQLKDILLAP